MKEKKKFNLRQKIAVIIIDVLLLLEVTYSIYRCHADIENATEIFLKTYIPLALGTVAIGFLVIRVLRQSSSDLKTQAIG